MFSIKPDILSTVCADFKNYYHQLDSIGHEIRDIAKVNKINVQTYSEVQSKIKYLSENLASERDNMLQLSTTIFQRIY